MVFLSASKVMVGDKTKKKKQDVSIEIRGPLASTKEHQYNLMQRNKIHISYRLKCLCLLHDMCKIAFNELKELYE